MHDKYCSEEELSGFKPGIKEIVERRHGEPIKFLFLPKMGLLDSQAGNEKNCWLWNMSNFWGLFFNVFMVKILFYLFFFIVESAPVSVDLRVNRINAL